jgi:hypothetical protein
MSYIAIRDNNSACKPTAFLVETVEIFKGCPAIEVRPCEPSSMAAYEPRRAPHHVADSTANPISDQRRALEGYRGDVVVIITRRGAPNAADCPL